MYAHNSQKSTSKCHCGADPSGDGNIIRTFDLEANYLDNDNPWRGILAATAFAVRSTYHTTLRKMPGQHVFGCDMIFNIHHVTNWEYIRQNKQHLIYKNNKAENA